MTYAGLQQKRMWKQAEFQNLQTANRNDLVFLRTMMMETLNAENSMTEAVRRMYRLFAPEDLRDALHSALDDILAGMVTAL